MIRIKLAAQEKDLRDQEIAIHSGETLEDAIKRILAEAKVTENEKEIFQAAVNGLVVESDLWAFTILKNTDTVIIVPRIKDGDSGQILGQIIVIAAIAVASAYLAPAMGLGVFGTSMLTSVVGIAASYAVSQLIPPPVIAGDSAPTDFTSSQMYSITSQSNQVKKFGKVPKVYGRHKMFPNVAANPYTDLETDPTTGKLVQYLYAVYDLGFGPNIVEDIKIGDTPIQNFSDVQFRLVDFNKPTVSEGVWDDALDNQLTYYKGDFSSDSVSVELNGNQSNGGPVDTYYLTRNAGSNPTSVEQEITVNFVNPRGLFGMDSKGNVGFRGIDLDIFFSKVGEDIWRPYNDLSYVKAFTSAGGSTETQDVQLAPQNDVSFVNGNLSPSGSSHLDLISQTDYTVATMLNGSPLTSKKTMVIGLLAYRPSIYLQYAPSLFIGDTIGDGAGSPVYHVTNVLHVGTFYTIAYIQPYRNVPVHTHTVTVTRYEQTSGIHNAGDYVYDVQTFPFLKRLATVGGRLRIYAANREPNYSTVKFTPKQIGEYKIKITRVRTTGPLPYTSTVFDDLTVINLNTRLDALPIVTDKRHTFLELRIKASGQLNGAIQNLSAVCTSVLDTWNGSAWVKQATNNPAWVYADILTGEVNKRAIAKSRLHIASLVEWANYCNQVPTSGTLYTYVEKRFSSNFILDYTATVQQLLTQVSGAAQASFNIIDGKYGVLLDINRTTPVQIFTPRNSTGFSSTRIYTSRPHALKVSFIDPNAEWQQNETIVYDTGYNKNTATEFEEITSFACTSIEQAFRFGRYFMAQNKLRQETISLKVDFEHLVCTRGDFVQISQDAMKVGGTPARVKSKSGNQIVIDEGIETLPVSYGYVFRNSNTGSIETNTLTVVSSDTFNVAGTVPNVGDLIIIGEVTKIVLDCIVKAITPNDDLSASIQLVEKAAQIYSIESIDVIPDYNPNISNTVDGNFQAPPEVQNLVVTANTYRILTSGYEYYIDIDWEPSLGAAYELFEVYLDIGNGYDLVSQTKATDFRQIVDVDNLGKVHNFKVLAVSATGKKLSLGEVGFVTATPLKKSTPPSNVEVFNSDITNEVIQFFWERVSDLDIKEYIIRFTPDVSGSWETSTILLRVSANDSLVSTQARTGTYLIKAIDFNGNESLVAAAIITTIPNLFGLNVISSINDFPALTGSKDKVKVLSNSLILEEAVSGPLGTEEYYSEGFYYYQNLLDLGEIYTVRIQSLLKAEGYSKYDIMSNWVSLDLVNLLYTPTSAEWDVEAQYRGTNSLNVMSDWTALSSIITLSQGSEDIWTPWRKFIIGDVTARILQFRLRLVSNVLNISPRVLDGSLKADMPDRVESYPNLSAPSTGYTVTYSPAFKGPTPSPSVQISLENGQAGDKWSFTSKTVNGFTIAFFDINNNPVARQFDAQIKGFGRKAAGTI
jgi:predicted phage tail protein